MNTEYFKEKLLNEKARLEAELGGIGRKNGGEEWQAKNTVDADPAEDSEMADKFEELSLNESIVSTLEAQLKDVDAALEKIAAGTYGVCEVSGDPIELDRLEANPAARTCKTHMNN